MNSLASLSRIETLPWPHTSISKTHTKCQPWSLPTSTVLQKGTRGSLSLGLNPLAFREFAWTPQHKGVRLQAALLRGSGMLHMD